MIIGKAPVLILYEVSVGRKKKKTRAATNLEILYFFQWGNRQLASEEKKLKLMIHELHNHFQAFEKKKKIDTFVTAKQFG